MMCDASPTAGAIRVKRWAIIALLTITMTLLVGGSLMAAWWGLGRIPTWFFWVVGLVFLLAVELIYGTAVVLTAVALPVLSVLLIRGRGRRGPQPWGMAVPRGLLLCAALSICLVAAEVVSAVWQARARRQTAVPIGGLRRGAETEDSARPPIAPADVTLPTRFSESGDDRSLDVVVLGESSAEGVPYNGWLSIGAIVSWQLDELLPGRRVRFQLLARMGDTLEAQHRKLATLKRRPDLLIAYCGHNEFASRYHPSRVVDHYVDSRRLTAWRILVEWNERTSAFCGLIRETADRCRLAIPTPPGRGALVDVPAHTPGEFRALLADFHRRLETIASYAERIGAVLVLIVPPSNDADFEPNRSFLPTSTPRVEREEFERAFRAARRMEMTDPALARAMYQRLLGQQPGFAETHYRLARLLERAGAWDEAYGHFIAARDLDGYPIRCPGPFQDAYRSVAERHDCILVDGQAVFRAIGRHGLLDDRLFHDAVHPTLRGHIALAQAVLAALQARGAWAWPASRLAPVIDPSQCAAHFGMQPSSWKYVCAIGATAYVKMCRWTHDAGERLGKAEAYDAARGRIERGAAPESLGLPNLGIPEPVPALCPSALQGRGTDSGPWIASPTSESSPYRRSRCP
jgi:hypothetical protein